MLPVERTIGRSPALLCWKLKVRVLRGKVNRFKMSGVVGGLSMQKNASSDASKVHQLSESKKEVTIKEKERKEGKRGSETAPV